MDVFLLFADRRSAESAGRRLRSEGFEVELEIQHDATVGLGVREVASGAVDVAVAEWTARAAALGGDFVACGGP